MEMPFLNGIGLAKKIKEIYGPRNIRCPIVCASADEVDKDVAHHFVGILMKPLSHQDVEELIKKYIHSQNKLMYNVYCTCEKS
jgi:two-component SAPR family response regulator